MGEKSENLGAGNTAREAHEDVEISTLNSSKLTSHPYKDQPRDAQTNAIALGGRKAGSGGIDLNDAGLADRGHYDRDELSTRLAAIASSWIPQYFPKGRINDDRSEIRLADITGRAPRKQGSCVISLTGEKAGCWYEFDGSESGGPLSTLQKASGKSGRELLDLAAQITGANGAPRETPVSSKVVLKSPRDPSAEIAHILARSVPLAGTLAETYLKSRGLEDPQCQDLLFCSNTTDWKAGVGRPAMIGIPRLANGEPTGGIHRTYLAYDGGGKADMPNPKKMLGSMENGAIRLAPMGEDGRLGIAEGIETALAAMQLYGLPVWAATAAPFMGGRTKSGAWTGFIPPPGLKALYIFADKGNAGMRAANKLLFETQKSGLPAAIVEPVGNDDFADDLANGAGVRPLPATNASSKDIREFEDFRPPGFTDEALALTFAERHADALRYVAGWGKWLTWQETRWVFDETLLAFDLARKVCREFSSVCADENVAASIASARTVAAVERLAKADRRLAATVDQWDANPWLLNTPAGAVDLKTGIVRPHQREDYMTKLTAAVPASPGSPCPLWSSFLNYVMDKDDDLVQFTQRVTGYSLTGITREHALFFLHGTGANGKGVFLNTISGVLSDYATTAPMETFTASRSDRHPTELAGLMGARLVSSVETEEGRNWAESRIKSLTGGDKISARFMRQDFFEFAPQFKLVIAGNHKPGLRGVDEAIRRRMNLIPFTVTIPEKERDQKLTEKLHAEWPAILRWMIDGCLSWQQEGLAAPDAVRSATDRYLEAEDALLNWIEEHCIKTVNEFETSSHLFESWRNWADCAGEYVGSMKRFVQRLEAHGFTPCRRNNARGFSGIQLAGSDVPNTGEPAAASPDTSGG